MGYSPSAHRSSRRNSRSRRIPGLQSVPAKIAAGIRSALLPIPRLLRYASGYNIVVHVAFIVLAFGTAAQRVLRTCKPPVRAPAACPSQPPQDLRALLPLTRFYGTLAVKHGCTLDAHDARDGNSRFQLIGTL